MVAGSEADVEAVEEDVDSEVHGAPLVVMTVVMQWVVVRPLRLVLWCWALGHAG